MKKIVYQSLLILAMIALAGCGTKPEACRADEMAKAVKLQRTVATMYYNEETGQTGSVSDTLAPGYYNYQGEAEDYYLVCLGQDSPYTIPKSDSEIVTLTAAQGHGYVLFFNEKQSTIFLKAEPSDDAKTIESFPDPDGIPEDAECLGICGEWYKVKYGGKTAYVKRSEVEWSISCADACGEIR